MIRRVILLFVLLPLGVVVSLGQDNQNTTEIDEIFQVGRKWTIIGRILVSPQPGGAGWVFSLHGCKCEGVEDVDGHLSSVISEYSIFDIDNPLEVEDEALFSDENKDYTCYIYRERSSYYLHYANNNDDQLLFDFSTNVSDTLYQEIPYKLILDDDTLSALPYLVKEVGDTILEESSDKRLRKWLSVCSLLHGEEDIWIEGIGSMRFGPIGSRFGTSGASHILYKCFDEENIYYFNKNIPWYKELLSSIQPIENDNDTDSNKNEGVQGTYTLQGIKADTPSKGIHIIRYRDGKTRKVYRPY